MHNPELTTGIVLDEEATPDALSTAARRWLGWLQWASVALVLCEGFRLGLLLLLGPERTLVPLPTGLRWLVAGTSLTALVVYMVFLLGTLRHLHALQQQVSARPMRWPFWLLPASQLLPLVNLAMLGWYVHAVLRITPVRSLAPVLHRAFWALPCAKALLLCAAFAFGYALAMQRDGQATLPENFTYLLQPLQALDALLGIAACAVWWWVLAYVIELLDPGPAGAEAGSPVLKGGAA